MNEEACSMTTVYFYFNPRGKSGITFVLIETWGRLVLQRNKSK